MNIRILESFMAVAEEESFSQASRRLHRSQSAVSSHVLQLEEELGVPLFERTTRKVTVTSQGRRLLTSCRTSLAELKNAALELSEEALLKRGSISIGTVPSLSAQQLPRILSGFKRQYPGVTIKLHEESATRLYEAVRERIVDFALAPWVLGTDDLEREKVIDDPLVAVFPSSIAPLKNSVSLKDVATYDLVSHQQNTAHGAHISSAFAKLGLEFKPLIEVSHHQTVLEMVKAGLGAALLPRLCLPLKPLSGVRVIQLRPQLKREIAIVTLRGKVLSPPAAQCAMLISQTLKTR